jgi:hypothetical protein
MNYEVMDLKETDTYGTTLNKMVRPGNDKTKGEKKDQEISRKRNIVGRKKGLQTLSTSTRLKRRRYLLDVPYSCLPRVDRVARNPFECGCVRAPGGC